MFAYGWIESEKGTEMSLFAKAATAQPQTARPGLRPATAGAPTAARPMAPAPAQAPPASAQRGRQQDEPRRPAPADVYDGIEKEKDLSRTYLDELGSYLLEVVQLQDGIKPKGTKNAGKPFFGADFKVIDSDNPNFPAESEVSWMSTQNDYPEYHLRAINNLLSAILQVDPSQINRDTVTDAVSENNPAAGRYVICRVTPDPKGGVSENGKPYTRKKFMPYIPDAGSDVGGDGQTHDE